MDHFENEIFRKLVFMKARELEEIGTEEAIEMSEKLRSFITSVYAFQAKQKDGANEKS